TERSRHARERAGRARARVREWDACARDRRHGRCPHRCDRRVPRERARGSTRGSRRCDRTWQGGASGTAAGRPGGFGCDRGAATGTRVMQRSEITIDLGAVRHNVRTLLDALEGSRLWAVVKADAYGHGAEDVARAALTGGASALCVATIPEGL